MKRQYFGLLVIFYILNSVALGKVLDRASLKGIQEKLKQHDYLTVNFKQEIYSSLRKSTRNVEGEAFFAKPSKFYWSQSGNEKKIYIYDGKELVEYLPDQKIAHKFLSTDILAKRFNKLTKLVLNLEDLLSEYTDESIEEDEKSSKITIKLKPKNKIGVDYIILGINSKSNFVESVILSHTDGKRYSYYFSNPSKAVINPQKFIADLPKDVKIQSL